MTTTKDTLIVTPEVQAANRAEHDARKAAARTRKAHEAYDKALRLDRIAEAARVAREAAANAAPVVVETSEAKKPVVKGVIIPADPAETERLRLANAEADRIATERKAAREEAKKPISAEVLAAGLEADRAAEAKRASDEVARVALLADGYKADIRKSANGINYSDKLSLQEKVTALLEMGFVHVADGKGGRDAEYFHAKSGVKFLLKGAGLGTQEVVRPHKARGCELLPPMTAADHEARRIKKIAEKAALKAGKAPKETPAQAKKREEKAKKATAAANKAAKKRK